MENSNEDKSKLKQDYLEKLTPLFEYIPFLKEKEGLVTRSYYGGDLAPVHSVPVPVYDGRVLSFVKAAQKTGLVNKNWVYAYQRVGANNPKDERLYISGASFKDIDVVISILAKYVLGGMTKGVMWSEAVSEGVWLHCLLKLKQLLEVFDHPLA